MGHIGAPHTVDSLADLRDVAIPTAIREGKWAGESTFVSHDGREVPVSQVIVAHKDENGSPSYLSTIARDISESKHYARQMKQSNMRKYST